MENATEKLFPVGRSWYHEKGSGNESDRTLNWHKRTKSLYRGNPKRNNFVGLEHSPGMERVREGLESSVRL